MLPLNLGGLEGMKAFGIDLLGEHREDFPPDYLRWIEIGKTLTTTDIEKDQAIRSEVYDAIQGVLSTHELLVSPTLAAMPVDNAKNGETKGPNHVNAVEVDPLIGWCMTYLFNFTGHPAASVPAGLGHRLPVGIQLNGQRFADADVLAGAATIERVRPWKYAYRVCAERPIAVRVA
jgi:amidase/aspartyl-tRNA(Asn)/glutamyl-tRNA(Gln) amidotransferase subunit A